MTFPIIQHYPVIPNSMPRLQYGLGPTMVMAISSPTEIPKKAKHFGRIADSYWQVDGA